MKDPGRKDLFPIAGRIAKAGYDLAEGHTRMAARQLAHAVAALRFFLPHEEREELAQLLRQPDKAEIFEWGEPPPHRTPGEVIHGALL